MFNLTGERNDFLEKLAIEALNIYELRQKYFRKNNIRCIGSFFSFLKVVLKRVKTILRTPASKDCCRNQQPVFGPSPVHYTSPSTLGPLLQFFPLLPRTTSRRELYLYNTDKQMAILSSSSLFSRKEFAITKDTLSFIK
uniref:Uncharacterized protein n=1 Tax=Glossina pallidipes TaxID=7398 RepID=A0A1B0ACR6_GLOPL